MTLRQLQDEITSGRPVVVLIQAYKDDDDPTPYQDDWNNGHYVVAIGYDNDFIYFEDPWLLGTIGYMEKTDFLNRWHDTISS